MNEFKLTPLEIKDMRNDIKNLVNQMTIPIAYFENDYSPGYSDNNSFWTEYEDYKCGIEEVDETTINRLDYGDIEKGNVVLYLPYNTTLPKADKYRIDYNDTVYTNDSGYVPKRHLDGTILYYLLVGRR